MQKYVALHRFLPVFVLLISSLSCGGGGGGDSQTSPSGGSPVVAFGEITGFGSVFVNGIEFDMSGASVMLDDSPGDETQLRIGMMVRVEGKIDDNDHTTVPRGQAHRVTYMDDLEGPISDIDYTNRTFVALGQTVVVSDRTHFEDAAGLDQLEVGTIVEVSGMVDANEAIQATFVELKKPDFVPGDDEIEVKGTISNLNADNTTFELKGLIVDYSNAQLEDVPNGELANGMFVEVRSRQGIVDGKLIASEVEVENKPWGFSDDDMHEGQYAEMEGIVTKFTSSSDFEINGHPVKTTAQTTFPNGSSAQIALNVNHLEVEGFLDATGVLVASWIWFVPGPWDY